MSETAVASAPKPAKVKKAASKPKAPAAHPTYLVMTSAAISALKERTGSSRQAILKYIMANYKVGNDSKAVNARLKTALRNGTKSGALKNAKKGATGANGSFRLGEKPKAAPKKKVVKAKKPKTPKKAAKKVKAKKPAGEKKAKAAPKKAKSPKKAAAAKKPKAAASKKPKAAKKSPKKAAAKKPAAKKAAKK